MASIDIEALGENRASFIHFPVLPWQHFDLSIQQAPRATQ
jgi:hypothetical protein